MGLSPCDLKALVTQPIEVLTGLAEERGFTEEEVNTLRDIRRRGKNLIAAHNCRNRKLGEVEVQDTIFQTCPIVNFPLRNLESKLEKLRKILKGQRNITFIY